MRELLKLVLIVDARQDFAERRVRLRLQREELDVVRRCNSLVNELGLPEDVGGAQNSRTQGVGIEGSENLFESFSRAARDRRSD